jgi:hypothetical protein
MPVNKKIKIRLRHVFRRSHVHGLFTCCCLVLAGCAAPLPPQQEAPRQGTTAPAPAQATAPLPPSGALPAPSSTGAALPPAQAEAAAPDKPTLLRSWVDQQAHLYEVAAPLLIDNTELCPRHARNLLGFTAKNRYSYSDAFADTAQSELNLGERLRVMNVLPGSGAEKAGLEKGDTLVAVEIEPMPQGPDAERSGAALIASELQGRNNVSLTVLRKDERMVLDIPLTPACAMVIDLGNADFAASLADGQRIMVTRGMLKQVQSDEELAYVLAQQIARNILTDRPLPDVAAQIDLLHTLAPQPANAATASNLPPDASDLSMRERKLALFLLARAGYGIDGAPMFWQRQATPSLNEADLAALTEVIGAIRAKQQLNSPLIPEQL